jgi:hypothetical protein
MALDQLPCFPSNLPKCQDRAVPKVFWYGFGKYDGYVIYEAPDNVSLAGAVLAITAGGALASVETTVLMTVEETLEALAKGKDIGYRRPGE